MPSVPQLRPKAEDCAFGDFIHLDAAPGGWDPTKYSIYQFADPTPRPELMAAFTGDDDCHASPANVRRYEPWTFSLKPWHDPDTGKERRVWQRVN